MVTLTLHRPEARNALSTPCLEQLVFLLDQADADSGVGAVVIAGAARFFAAGADLHELQRQDLPPRWRIAVRSCGSGWRSSASRCWRR